MTRNQHLPTAFELLAKGSFQRGLDQLALDDRWNDLSETLDGPFYLGFPHDPGGWGEGLLLASLLKRHAVRSRRSISVCAAPHVCSILKHDAAFSIKSTGGRPPLAILKSALLGDLLQLGFERVRSGRIQSKKKNRMRVGVAWASVSNTGPIKEKSVCPFEFLSILQNIDADVVSFQRGLAVDESKIPSNRLNAIITDKLLHDPDQTAVVQEITNLDCMLSVSTTTAHIAACLGVPVILLVAKRKGQQWFWRIQADNRVCIYPHVDVVLGGRGKRWWDDCLPRAKRSLVARLNRPS